MGQITRNQLVGSNFSFQHYPFEYFAESMNGLGLKEIELWAIAPHLELLSATNSDVENVRRVLEQYDLSVFCLTPEQVMYPINIASGDESYRNRSIARMKRAIDAAVILGAQHLFVTAGRGYENEDRETVIERSSQSLRELTMHASEVGIGCLLEPLQRRESNILNSSSDLYEMVNRVDSSNVFVVLDTVAMACSGDSIGSYFDLFGDKIRHVQFVDGRPAGHLAWGDGVLPLESYVRALGDHGYAGRIGFEIFGDGTYGLDPMPAFEQCLSGIEEAMAKHG